MRWCHHSHLVSPLLKVTGRNFTLDSEKEEWDDEKLLSFCRAWRWLSYPLGTGITSQVCPGTYRGRFIA